MFCFSNLNLTLLKNSLLSINKNYLLNYFFKLNTNDWKKLKIKFVEYNLNIYLFKNNFNNNNYLYNKHFFSVSKKKNWFIYFESFNYYKKIQKLYSITNYCFCFSLLIKNKIYPIIFMKEINNQLTLLKSISKYRKQSNFIKKVTNFFIDINLCLYFYFITLKLFYYIQIIKIINKKYLLIYKY